jgi:hypothetical protein
MFAHNDLLNAYRVRGGAMASDDRLGVSGCFRVPCGNVVLTVVASDGNPNCGLDLETGWEHVSVSLPDRCPTWEEMDHVRSLWWRADEAVMQLHVPRHLHVNCYPFCLHLWRPLRATIPLPPPELVGPVARKGRG